MVRNYFGTDGIRGSANTDPMTAEVALRVGMAAGRIFTRGAHRHSVVIGKDTRLSGYMLEPALAAGFVQQRRRTPNPRNPVERAYDHIQNLQKSTDASVRTHLHSPNSP